MESEADWCRGPGGPGTAPVLHLPAPDEKARQQLLTAEVGETAVRDGASGGGDADAGHQTDAHAGLAASASTGYQEVQCPAHSPQRAVGHTRVRLWALALGSMVATAGMLAAGTIRLDGGRLRPEVRSPAGSSETRVHARGRAGATPATARHIALRTGPAAGRVTGSLPGQMHFQQLGVVKGQRGKWGWGLVNPATGIPRVECGDSVADGAFDAGEYDESSAIAALKTRFHAAVNTTFVVECPACKASGTRSLVYGCGPFLDSSSICRAATMEGKLGLAHPGLVAFTLVEPVKDYQGCQKMAYDDILDPTAAYSSERLTSFGYDWAEWYKASDPRKLAAYGEEKCVLKYRTNCYRKKDLSRCHGLRAFQIIDPPFFDVLPPQVHPGPFTANAPGLFVDKVTITMEAPIGLRTVAKIFYTLDNTFPTEESHEYAEPLTFSVLPGGPAKRIHLKALAWVNVPPFYGDVVVRDFIVRPREENDCAEHHCREDAHGNMEIEYSDPTAAVAAAAANRALWAPTAAAGSPAAEVEAVAALEATDIEGRAEVALKVSESKASEIHVASAAEQRAFAAALTAAGTPQESTAITAAYTAAETAEEALEAGRDASVKASAMVQQAATALQAASRAAAMAGSAGPAAIEAAAAAVAQTNAAAQMAEAAADTKAAESIRTAVGAEKASRLAGGSSEAPSASSAAAAAASEDLAKLEAQSEIAQTQAHALHDQAVIAQAALAAPPGTDFKDVIDTIGLPAGAELPLIIDAKDVKPLVQVASNNTFPLAPLVAAGQEQGGLADPRVVTESEVPDPVVKEHAEAECEHGALSCVEIAHETRREAFIKIPFGDCEDERVLFSLNSSKIDPVRFMSGETVQDGFKIFECGVNDHWEKEKVHRLENYLYGEHVPIPDSIPLSEISEDALQNPSEKNEIGHASSEEIADEGGQDEEEEDALDEFRELGLVLSFRTEQGCELLLPPGEWNVKTIGYCPEMGKASHEVDQAINIDDEKVTDDTASVPVMTLQYGDGIPIAQTSPPKFIADTPAVPRDQLIWSYDVDSKEFEPTGVKIFNKVEQAVYLQIWCPEGWHAHFSVNANLVNDFSRRTGADGLVLLSYGVNKVKSVCVSQDERISNITQMEVIVALAGKDDDDDDGQDEAVSDQSHAAEEIGIKDAEKEAIREEANKEFSDAAPTLKIPNIIISSRDGSHFEDPQEDEEFPNYSIDVVDMKQDDAAVAAVECESGTPLCTINDPGIGIHSPAVANGKIALLLGENYLRCLCVDEEGGAKSAVRAMQVMVTVQDLLDHFDRQAQQEVQKMKTGDRGDETTQTESEGEFEEDSDATGDRETQDKLPPKSTLHACTKFGEVCWFRSPANDCFSSAGDRCHNEVVSHHKMSSINMPWNIRAGAGSLIWCF